MKRTNGQPNFSNLYTYANITLVDIIEEGKFYQGPFDCRVRFLTLAIQVTDDQIL